MFILIFNQTNIFISNGMEDLKIITYDGFVTMIENHDLFIDENKIRTFINSSENVKKYHTHLMKHFKKSLSKNANYVQKGGDMSVLAGIGGIGLFLVLGYFIMKWTKPKKCRPDYQILQEGEYPTTIEFLEKIVPASWLGETNNPNKAVYNLKHKISTLSKALSVIDTNGSVLKSIGVNLLRVTSSVALDVATVGAGGDIIISLLFTFRSILDLISAIVTHLNDIISDPDAMRLLYDILNVDFKGGPFHVKCWIRYILREYGDETSAYHTVCSFFNKIFDKLANFMGNALGAMIPDSIGIPGMLIPLLIKQFKSGAISIIEKQINKYYKKIPRDIKLMIKNPKIMKKFLDRKISKANHYLLGFGSGLANLLKDNTWGFAYSIHKFFALMFSLFYILRVCLNEK